MDTVATSSLYERLAESRARLDRLDRERSRTGNRLLGKGVEQRIIWLELLDLELQDIDEQIERVCGACKQQG
jgi:hypothetical protein